MRHARRQHPNRPRDYTRPAARRAARPPLPDVLPGDLFVVVYDRDSQSFTLIVDDESSSSYNLGVDLAVIARYFRRIGHFALGDKATDIAREFGGAAALLLPGGYVTPVKPGDDGDDPAVKDPFAKNRRNPTLSLPRLG